MPRTSSRAAAGNLPVEVTSFVGRRQELAELRRLLAAARLVTLTGVGGVGKTRLALRVAAGLQPSFPDGVWLADLTLLRELGGAAGDGDAEVLAHLLAAVLQVREQGAAAPLRALTDQLAGWQALLVLDNCEHLLPACRELSEELLRACPGLRILATSREPLAHAAEVVRPVAPLPAPGPEADRGPASELIRSEAVVLFVARGQSALPTFRLTADNQAAVAQLCRRLDGLPLAIELAAARIRALSAEQILQRLTDRFALLTRGSRTAPERQQTLRACVDWSFELCSKPERLLWRRLTVFVGGFEPDAAAAVCADEDLAAADVPELLTGLADRSVLEPAGPAPGAEQAGPTRYRMLETIRGFGQEQLRQAGEEAAARDRHRDWCERLVADARAGWTGVRQAWWLARLGREHANLRAAVDHCLTGPGAAEGALRLAVTLPGFYWTARGLFGEGRRWLDAALALSPEPNALRAGALLIDSYLAFAQGDVPNGLVLLEQGRQLAERLDAPAELAYAGFLVGLGGLFAGDVRGAAEALGAAAATLDRVPDPDQDLLVHLLMAYTIAAALAGAPERAVAIRAQLLAVTEPMGAAYYRSNALWAAGLVTWVHGDLPAAGEQVLEALRLKRGWATYDRYGAALCLETLAWLVGDHQQHGRAATLLGAAGTLWSELGTPIESYQHLIGFHRRCEQQARDALGAGYEEAWSGGRGLAYAEALSVALDDQPEPSAVQAGAGVAPAGAGLGAPGGTGPGAPHPLTQRELQVAELVAGGRSNREIAAELVISQRTAEGHVQRILDKLGLANRTQIIGWLREHRG